MKITINPAIRHVQPFIERLPEVFPVSGEVLHEGRNQIRAFDIGGESLVVKRYKRPHLFNRVMYSFFRKNKARRAYEHALRLRGMGFDTPEPVAWSEYRKDGLIADTYFVSRRSELTPLPQTMRRFPAPDTLPVLEAFARFTVRLHEQGICHEDFNQTNILWEYDGAAGNYRFQLIDINRMRFHARPLRPDECMINLRRLSCPAVPFLYIYAGGTSTTRCCGGLSSACSSAAGSSSKSGSGNGNRPQQAKNRAENLDSANILLHLSLLIPTRDETLRFCILLFLLFLL